MYRYAQTNIQLFNQMQQAGYSRFELEQIALAYKLAMQLFTGRFRSSGKTFIAHLVGTASILINLKVSYQLVMAGLLHAAYSHGDFGESGTGIAKSKQERVIGVIGREAENYIARYTALVWNAETIPRIEQQIEKFGQCEREILLIRLANELEERLDLGVLYCRDAKFEIYAERDHYLTKLAEKLGYPSLEAEFEIVLTELAAAHLPPEICNLTRQKYSTLVVPNSCRKKLRGRIKQALVDQIRHWKLLPVLNQ